MPDDFVLDELIKKATTPHRSDRWLEILGIPTRLAVYAMAFGILWSAAPDPIGDKPLGSITLHQIFISTFWLFLIVAWGYLLFHPSRSGEMRRGWGGLGILLIFGATFGLVYILRS